MKITLHAVCVGLLLFSTVSAAQDKPNILIIWGDDIGWNNVGAYNRGMMAYDTPNIDSIANDGMMFTDAYGQNSCTAGRSAVIVYRSGLTKGTGVLSGRRRIDVTMSITRIPL